MVDKDEYKGDRISSLTKEVLGACNIMRQKKPELERARKAKEISIIDEMKT